jgi:hypothetical protein
MSPSLRSFGSTIAMSAALLAAISLAGCPEDDVSSVADATAPSTTSPAPTSSTAPPSAEDAAVSDASKPARPSTHAGLVSIQDISIANAPAAGHGLTVTALLGPAVTPDYEEIPGSIQGCRVFTYDVDTKPQPPDQDLGVLRLGGVVGGNLECRFVPQRGYVCPTATHTGNVTVEVSPSGTTYSVPGASFGANDVGRYLQITGSANASNAGAFAVLAAPSATAVMVANPRAVSESFSGSATVLAGAGPTPNDLFRPFEGVSGVELALPEKSVFAAPKTTLRPGDAFTMDDASTKTLMAIPVDGAPVTLRCATCGTADGTIVRLQTTDASVTGLSPVAFPTARKKSVEIQCVRLGTGQVTVPAAAMAFVEQAHRASPITRIRAAFMRDGLFVHTASEPLPANRVAFAVGRGTLGFSRP